MPGRNEKISTTQHDSWNQPLLGANNTERFQATNYFIVSKQSEFKQISFFVINEFALRQL